MRIVNKPWGNEEIFAETSSYVGKILTVLPNHRLSRQYHIYKEETFRVLSGTLTLEIGEAPSIQTFVLKPSETFHCAPKTVHRMICDPILNSAPIQIIEVSTNHLDDVVRLEDDYKR